MLQVSRIKAQVGAPFTVEYVMDAANRAHFKIEQENFTGKHHRVVPYEGKRYCESYWTDSFFLFIYWFDSFQDDLVYSRFSVGEISYWVILVRWISW